MARLGGQGELRFFPRCHRDRLCGLFVETITRGIEADHCGVHYESSPGTSDLLAAARVRSLLPFPDFPKRIPAHVIPHAILLVGPPPNGVPSVHTSNALLACWFLRHWAAGRILSGFFLMLTVLSTLGFGEHYLVDLIAAVPYSWLVYRLAEWIVLHICNSQLDHLTVGQVGIPGGSPVRTDCKNEAQL